MLENNKITTNQNQNNLVIKTWKKTVIPKSFWSRKIFTSTQMIMTGFGLKRQEPANLFWLAKV